ncbi:MAG: Hsp20/alpha crystallin family protein [Clostridiales bacterium]|nr:Hsp20/alpha crystallin family protein [Clostridiales bacterium]
MYNIIPRRGQIVRKGRDYDVFDMMDDFFNKSFFEPIGNMTHMKTDIRQTDNEYIIEAELPGFDKKDIKLELKNNYLTISAGKDEESEESGEGYLRRERRSGQVCRSFYVEGIEQSDINAKYDKGILEVNLPKKQKEEETESTIEIK